MHKKEEEVRKEEDKSRKAEEKIVNLMKDKESNEKEIKERDKTIADKELRIYDLKKQNQELQKFKFVLDYKIKELKAQIDPKTADIASIKTQKRRLRDDLSLIKRFKIDMSEVVENMGDQKALKDSITAVYRKYTGPLKKSDLDTDMQKDYNRQRDYLEKSVDSLKKKLEKDSQA